MKNIHASVRVIKKWGHSPTAKLELTKDGQSVQLSINEFVEALKDELAEHLYSNLAGAIGSVTWVFRKDTFKAMVDEAIHKELPKAMNDASTKVIRAMKQHSIYNFVRNE